MVSAGFDAHVEETLAGLCLTDDDYAWLGLQIKNIAKQCCNQRVILSLEGGYHLQALGRSVTSLLTAFI
jgi:acetoin utilization deacetylase AcuC-like enzyme